ncbi:MAG TPA: mannose-1-phosphate guanylyltransferase/mannose-6-phosphate isomerase, partial [Gammaproteobacteria bacterium]
VLPSDHIIKNSAALTQAVREAMPQAEAGKLITFGVKPDRPATGYGYIKAGTQGLSAIESFVEKPDAATAQKYVSSGKYYWNSGMFLFRADAYLNELKRFEPETEQICAKAFKAMEKDLDFKRIPAAIFSVCRSNSVDYAVMEKTDKAMVIALDAGWSDLGSWESLWQVSEKNDRNNTIVGDVLLQDVSNSYVRADHRLVSVIGLDDCIVVETADAVLVASKQGAEQVKNLVADLQKRKRSEVELHRKVHRPWGSYESVDEGVGFKVKRITVKPGASLSLQMHHHRAEHWVVVKGEAQVSCDDKQYRLAENESTFIPLGAKHRLENPGNTPLELIEVQSGGYLGEDDIVRFDDKYGR